VLEPDRDQIEIFTEALFRHVGGQGFVSLRAFYEDDALGPFRITPTSLAGGLKFLVDVAEDDARRAANDPKPVVFCPPIAVFGSKERATEKELIAGPTLSVECDKGPENARLVLEQLLGSATLVVRSGGIWTDPTTSETQDKLHLHWRLAQPAKTAEEFKRLKQTRELAAHIVGGDPSNTPICHPIRWPGSWHRKGKPRLCEIETANPDNEIRLDDALAILALSKNLGKTKQPRGNEEDARQRVDWEDAFRKMLSGESYHPVLAPLASSMAAWGAPAPVTDNILRCLLLNSQPADAERMRRRDVELAKLAETVRSGYAKFAPKSEPPEQPSIYWHGEDAGAAITRGWLIDSLLPRSGVGLISGQWGLYKTFIGLDLAAAIMVGVAFIEYPITRRGGVLFIAAEGANEIPIRIEAVRKNKYPTHTGCLPFAWIDECPRLLGPKAVDGLAAIATQVAERLQREFTLPLALILIDTVVDAAGYSKAGDENDAALGQLIMRRMAELAQRTGAMVLGIDHFGKQVETGTRGSSAKEGRADVVLAIIGDKAITGEVTNTRLAIRKNRGAASGQELPFTTRPVDLGEEQTLVIDWEAPTAPQAAKDNDWGRGKGVKHLRRIIMSLLPEIGIDIRPFADGPMVRALKVDVVQAEFFKSYPGGGETAGAKRRARWAAFQRALTDAVGRNVLITREIGGEDYVWLAQPGKAEKT